MLCLGLAHGNFHIYPLKKKWLGWYLWMNRMITSEETSWWQQSSGRLSEWRGQLLLLPRNIHFDLLHEWEIKLLGATYHTVQNPFVSAVGAAVTHSTLFLRLIMLAIPYAKMALCGRLEATWGQGVHCYSIPSAWCQQVLQLDFLDCMECLCGLGDNDSVIWPAWKTVLPCWSAEGSSWLSTASGVNESTSCWALL